MKQRDQTANRVVKVALVALVIAGAMALAAILDGSNSAYGYPEPYPSGYPVHLPWVGTGYPEPYPATD